MGMVFVRLSKVLWLVMVSTGGFPALADAASGEPDRLSFVRKDDWRESLLASLEALHERGVEDGFAPFSSDVVRGGDPARSISVDVSGARGMYLIVDGAPDVVWGVANWAAPRLVSSDGTEVRLGKVEGIRAVEGRHSFDINLHSGLYEPLRIGGREFSDGLHVEAESIVWVPLAGRYRTFKCWIGVDDWSDGRGAVRFRVWGPRDGMRRRLWSAAMLAFPEAKPREEMRWEREDGILAGIARADAWRGLARAYARGAHRVPDLQRRAEALAQSVRGSEDLLEVRDLYLRSRRIAGAIDKARSFDFEAVRLAIDDLTATFPEEYASGPRFLARLRAFQRELDEALVRLDTKRLDDQERAARLGRELELLRKEALLSNPLLDFDRLVVIRRTPRGDPRRYRGADRGLGEFIGLPRQSSWGHSTIPDRDRWENEIAVLSPPRPRGKLATLFRPKGTRLLADIDLHFDGDRLLFAMPDERNRWQVHEMDITRNTVRQLTPGDQPEVHWYDACYLPDGGIVAISTAPLQGVPCNASVVVGMMYRMDADGRNIRQVCFEQDHDYCPSVLPNGRVLYLRWDYTDTPHVWNRLLMSMNPDGTGQMEYYGSNSYWPNAFFFARAVPDHPSRVVSIVTGHHEGRVGELVLLDPTLGRHETQGVVQRIPGRGKKVEPRIEDKLTEHSWPKFLHPYPLSSRYFLVAAKPRPGDLWGIYIADVFDNLLLLREEEHRVLLEPIPLRPTRKPPVIRDRTDLERDDALVQLLDVYAGPGLEGIPRGSVKKLRIFTYHFGYQTLAGIDHRVGADGPWEVKRVLGTVPVEEDGSAYFRIPARTPVSVQPLDADGRALALMRSWMTAMPGETLSCVGCHEPQGTVPSNRSAAAVRRGPSEIEPWYGEPRGFSFPREVQPVLDRHCVGCHDGSPSPDGTRIPDLRADQESLIVYERGNPIGTRVRGKSAAELRRKYGGVFTPSYVELRRWVRVGGLESDLHVLPPKEFHAGTSELVQMLEKGHHGVKLDREAWDRLNTWIDLNAPCHGTWGEVRDIPRNQRERRVALRALYGGVEEDGEEIPRGAPPSGPPAVPEPAQRPRRVEVSCEGWPFGIEEAKRRQEADGRPGAITLDLGGGVSMEFTRVPAGSFVLGSDDGDPDEAPQSRVSIARGFYMSVNEVTNEQFARFDPSHESRFEHRSSWIFDEAYLGWPLDGPRQPVVRVSCLQAMEFCRWLSEKTGKQVTLPTEVEWEYACRAGTSTPFYWGERDSDFSRFANLADATIRDLAFEGWRPRSPDIVPRDDRTSDGALVTADVGSYEANPWGLRDMLGNASEWTRSAYVPYASEPASAGEYGDPEVLRVVRGGSWRDRPVRCRAAFRLAYPAYQKVFNVGFRVVVQSDAGGEE